MSRRHLLRQGRGILSSSRSSNTPFEPTFTLTHMQTRSLRTQEIKLNIPSSAVGKSLNELEAEGVINSNVARFLHDIRSKEAIGTLGSGKNIIQQYEPHKNLTNPPAPDDITLELLLASQAHLGHSTALWHPGNARYIFGVREGIHIISLEETAAHLRRAAKIVRGVVEKGGMVLFAGTRRGHERAVVKAAQLSGGYYIFDKWIPGTLTNGSQLLSRCSLKVVDQLDRKLLGFEEQLQLHGAMKPDLVVCLNAGQNYVLLHECALNNIPTIGIVDTDVNPTWVTYPIPANDDSFRSVQVIAGVLGRAGEAGRKARLALADEGQIVANTGRALLMPEEYEATLTSAKQLEADGDGQEVIDLRDKQDYGRVRYDEALTQQELLKAKEWQVDAEQHLREYTEKLQRETRERKAAIEAQNDARHGQRGRRGASQYMAGTDKVDGDGGFRRRGSGAPRRGGPSPSRGGLSGNRGRGGIGAQGGSGRGRSGFSGNRGGRNSQKR